MCLGSSSNKTQTSAPTNPAVQSAYGNLLTQAQSLTSQPLQTYSGQLVAPLNQTQNTAIQDISNAQGVADPYLTEAAKYANLSATPLSVTPYNAENIGQYYSPFQNDVVNATEKQFNLQNAQQENSLKGNVAAAGALGGDRQAILESQLAAQQQTAEAPVIANLENQGFTNAQQQFNTTNNTSLAAQEATNQGQAQAGYALGALGPAAENAALTGANAKLAAGTLQQQNAQEQLNVPYEQYLQQMAYPYQNLDFLASLLPGVAQGTGLTTTGTSTSQPPLFGGTGSGALFTLADGGRVRHLAGGGLPYQPISLPAQSAAVPNAGMSFIPSLSTTPSLSYGKDQEGGESAGGGQGGGHGGSVSPGIGDSFLFGNPASGTAGASSGLVGTGGLDASMAAAGDAIGSGITDALAFIGLRHGGRSRLADGGTGDFDALLDQLYPTPASGPQDLASQPATTAAAPPANDNTLASAAPAAPEPTWDNGDPVNSTLASPSQIPKAMQEVIPAHTPSFWPVALATLGGLFDNKTGAIKAGLDEYEKDANPTVDHSGASMLVHYANGPTFDTGIPTEAALNAQATNNYRLANMDAVQKEREDAIAQRAQAASDAVAQRKASADDAAANRAEQLKIAQMNAEAGRYQWQPGTQVDANDPTKTITGMWRLPTRGGEAPQFIAGDDITGKTSGAGGISGRESVFFNRVTAAGNEAAAAMRNIMELPTAASRGLFGGRQQGPGLLDAAKESLTNAATSQDVQDYNTMVAGVSRNLAGIEAAGLAPNGSLQHSMDSVILKEGDSDLTKMRKLAEMRQIVEMGLSPNLSNPRIPQPQKDLVTDIIKQVQTAIPFTQHDVTAYQQQNNPRMTMADYMKSKNLGGSGAKFQNGQVYRDSKGNRAQYQDGQFVPLPKAVGQ